MDSDGYVYDKFQAPKWLQGCMLLGSSNDTWMHKFIDQRVNVKSTIERQ